MKTDFVSVALWMRSLMDPRGAVGEEELEEMAGNLEWCEVEGRG